MILEDELVALMPLVHRANAMAKELGRAVTFEIVLVSPEARGLDKGLTEVVHHWLNWKRIAYERFAERNWTFWITESVLGMFQRLLKTSNQRTRQCLSHFLWRKNISRCGSKCSIKPTTLISYGRRIDSCPDIMECKKCTRIKWMETRIGICLRFAFFLHSTDLVVLASFILVYRLNNIRNETPSTSLPIRKFSSDLPSFFCSHSHFWLIAKKWALPNLSILLLVLMAVPRAL